MRVVIDTNVLFGALHRRGGASREVVLACLRGDCQPVLSAALYQRFSLRGEADFADKLLSAMRHGFGGHLEIGAPPEDE